MVVEPIRYSWNDTDGDHEIGFVHVRGTHGHPYSFGEAPNLRSVEIQDFFIGTVPVTQALWTHTMGRHANPSVNRGPTLPLENVSWNELMRPDGFLQVINGSALRAAIPAQLESASGFRLPSETEWEYAARGGVHWQDGFLFSGGNDIEAVAWHDRRHGDHTQPVARKAPNQLGLYDMSGNVWEWCQDAYTPDVTNIPGDGAAFGDSGDERVLRGGCFHNWAAHCTVSKRYQIGRAFHDGCIGVRLVFSAGPSRAHHTPSRSRL